MTSAESERSLAVSAALDQMSTIMDRLFYGERDAPELGLLGLRRADGHRHAGLAGVGITETELNMWFYFAGLKRRRAPAPANPEPIFWKPEPGWRDCETERPSDRSMLIELRRAEWDSSSITTWSDMHSLMNVVGLYWRPWSGVTLEHSYGEQAPYISGVAVAELEVVEGAH